LSRLVHKQVNMLGHDHVTNDNQFIFVASSFETLEKQVAPLGAPQQWEPLITTEGQKMKIVTSVVPRGMSWHVQIVL
jgi:hypothetical protein